MHALQPGAAGEAWKALARRLPRPARDPDRVGALGDQPADAHRLGRSRRPSTTSTTSPSRSTGCATPRPARPRSRSARRRCSRTRASPPRSTAAAASITARGRRCSICIRRRTSRWCRSPCSPRSGPAIMSQLGNALRAAREGRRADHRLGPHDAQPARLVARPGRARAVRARIPGLGVRQAEAKDVDSLVDYRSRSPHGVRAHPTDEHFLPLSSRSAPLPRKRSPSASTTPSTAACWRWTPTSSPIELEQRRQEGADLASHCDRRRGVVADVRVAPDARVLVGEWLSGGGVDELPLRVLADPAAAHGLRVLRHARRRAAERVVEAVLRIRILGEQHVAPPPSGA